MPPAAQTPAAEGPSLPVAVGQVLAGKYRVDHVLGVGGMGVVAAATHVTLDQKVALKFLLPAALLVPDTKERFLREARAAVRLKSEHVAKVLDVGTLDDGSPYMVMEFLEGATLGQTLRHGRALAVADAVGFVLQACEGVAEAHMAGIVHRDLKPDNLFLTTGIDGRPLVKVLDFGIAKTAKVDGTLSLTRTSAIVGSPLYMPPEQLRSAKNVDARSDIWSLGAVLCEMLTGRVPFPADSFAELCIRATQEPAPVPSRRRPEISPDLDAVVLRCLEKDPDARFANVGELARALEPFAPDDARGFAERVASVLVASSLPRISTGTSPSSSGVQKAATGNAWGHTSGGATRRRRITWAGVGVAAFAVAVAIVSITRHAEAPSSASSAGPASTLVTPAAAPPGSVLSLVPVAATASGAAPSGSVSSSSSVQPTAPLGSSPSLPASLTPAPSPTGAAARPHGTQPPGVSAAPPPASARTAHPPPAATEGDIVFQRK
ncbi:MAG TPA: protein kinase [Polyangiaceae bacterium]